VVVLGVMGLVASMSATGWATATQGRSPSVSLRLPSHTLRAGQGVLVQIVNPSSRALLISGCFRLQIRQAHAWKTITRTHGVRVACSLTSGVALPAQPVDQWSLVLYDDLRPGMYRITMSYKVLPDGWHSASLRHNPQLLSAKVRVLSFRPGLIPHLTDRRIRRIALKAAGGHATLIQHAEGTRFEANLVAGGDLIPDWTWAYLIAIKGNFNLPPAGGTYAADLRWTRAGYLQHYSVITLVLNAKTGAAEDYGNANRYPDISKLGPVTTDYRR
jgi:hypothetical protein